MKRQAVSAGAPAPHELGRSAATPPRLWRFDEVEFDESRMELRVAGRPVVVQPMALGLLCSLLHAAPRLMRRDVLIVQLWKRSPDQVSRNVLSNAAGRLRKAIGDRQGLRIVSVPGIGYRLEGPLQSQTIDAPAAAPDGRPVLLPEAQEFLMRHWLDALHGRKGFDPSLSDVLRGAIGLAERELADTPLALAGLHQHLAEHDLSWAAYDSAATHFRLALALHAVAGQPASADGVLRLHFDLCRTLTLGAAASGSSPGLAHSRAELSRAQATAATNPALSPGTRLRALMADWTMAGFHLDWPRAMRVADAAMQLSDAMADLPAPQWFALQRNYGVTLARHGNLAAAIRKLQTLLTAQERPLPANDIQVLRTRLNLGQFQCLADQCVDALRTLEALRSALADNALAMTTFGVELDLWLAKTFMRCERGTEAKPLLKSAHQRACTMRGVSSEMALSVLVPLCRQMALDGEVDAAVQLLQAGVEPRLPGLSRAGQSEAIVALAQLILALWSAGRQAQARHLLPRLSLPDLRRACLRPSDASEYEAALSAIDHARLPVMPMPPVTQP